MDILAVIVPIFGLIISGWMLKKIGLLSEKILKMINDYVYYIGISVITFVSLHDTDLKIFLDTDVYVFMFMPIFIIIVLAFIISKYLKMDNKLVPVFILCAFFGNTGYIGFPVNMIIQGKDSLNIAAFISTVYTIIVFTLGIYIIKKYSDEEGEGMEIYKIPIIWAAVLGILLSWLPIPEILTLPVNIIIESTSPLALIATGAMVAAAGTHIDIKEIGILSALKLIIMPLSVVLIGMISGHDGKFYTTSLLEAGTPVGVTNTIIAAKFGLRYDFASNAVVISTILFAFTLPILIFFI